MKRTLARISEFFGGRLALGRMNREEFARADALIAEAPGPEALGDAMESMRLRYAQMGARVAMRSVMTGFGVGAGIGFAAIGLSAPQFLGVTLFSISAGVGAACGGVVSRRVSSARDVVGLSYQDAVADDFFRNPSAFMESALVKVRTPQERLRLHKAFGRVRRYVSDHQGEINAARQAAALDSLQP